MNKEELVLLKFDRKSEKEIEWEHGNEFEYKGQMYDVVEKKQVNDTAYFWCWPDKKETKFNKQLDNLVAHILGNMPQRRQHQNRLVNFLTNLYHSSSFQLHALLYSGDKIYRTVNNFSYYSIYHSPPAPPPEIV